MHFFAGTRTLLRAAAGLSPHQRDLDAIVLSMRQRLLSGKIIKPPNGPKLPPQFVKNRIRALQLRKLRRTISYVREHVPYYSRVLSAAHIRAADMKSLDDLSKLPVTRRADFVSEEFISRAAGQICAIKLPTTGTSGAPLVTYFSPQEFDRYTSVQAISGMAWGFLGPGHIAQLHLTFENTISAKIYNIAAFKAGTLVLNAGTSGNLDEHLDSLLMQRSLPGKNPQVSCLFAAPGFLWALAARSRQRGLKPEQFGLRRVFSAGAKVSAALKQQVLAAWGVRLMEGYSLAETASTGAYECDHGRMHFLDFSGIVEFLHPVTGQPVLPGEKGVAVITTLYPDRELMPVLRYWTDDLVQTCAEEFCPCGVATTSVDEILGRVDDAIIIGTQNFYPQPVGDSLTVFRELVQPPRFRIQQVETGDCFRFIIEIETVAPLDEAPAKILSEKILAAIPLSQANLITAGLVKCEVRLVSAGSIAAPFRYKLQGPAPF